MPDRLQPAMLLPAELRDLLLVLGEQAADCMEITARSWSSAKATYRLALASGRSAKARMLLESVSAEQLFTLRQSLACHDGFAGVLCWRDRWMIEEWVVGDPLHSDSAAPPLFAACGAILAQLHRSPIPDVVVSRSLVADELEACRLRLKAIERAGWLTPSESNELVRLAEGTAPGRAEAGVVHLDYCGENIVLHPDRGPVCIDNETMRVGAVDMDLARSIHRWRLSPSARTAFLSGYAEAGGPADPSAHRFWGLAAETLSADIRLRHSNPGIVAPVAALRDMLTAARRKRQG